MIKKKLNKNLEIEGVVFTMFDSRNNLSQDVVDNVRENLDELIYDTVVPRNVRLAEAPSYGLPINLYDPRSSGAAAYSSLADEVIKNKLFQ
jgi:chromosome partitioning protein